MTGERSNLGRRAASRLPGVRWHGLACPKLLSLLPVEAWACATCSLREPESAVRSVLWVVGLMLTPFVVLGVGLWAVRRAGREDARRNQA